MKKSHENGSEHLFLCVYKMHCNTFFRKLNNCIKIFAFCLECGILCSQFQQRKNKKHGFCLAAVVIIVMMTEN